MRIKNIKEHIKVYFFINPTVKMRVRQIERELLLSLPSVIRYCRELEKEGILKKTSIAGITAYSADRSSRKYLLEKKLFNMKSLFDFGVIDYLITEHANPVIVLFGSYAKGEDIESSDIDLYIETPKKQTFIVEKFGKILHRKIQIFNYKNIREITNKHLTNNIINGIVMNNFLEALP